MISCVILTKNAEADIIDCVESVLWCDEVIIIDDESEDRTVDLIKSLRKEKITVYKRRLDGDFSEQRNFGLSKAKNDWVLFIDADERLSASLQFEILNVLNNPALYNFYAFRFKRLDHIWGKDIHYGEAGKIKLVRLAKRDAGTWRGKVHEEWKVKGKVGELNNPIQHFPHKDVKEFLSDINFYTTLRAQELFEKRKKSKVISIVFYPSIKFVLNYFVKQGFRDGVAGLVLAMIMSFHSFLVRSKLYLLNRKR